MMEHKLSARRGFTLLECLVALTVTAILLAVILPAIQSARAQARRAECVSHLHQLGVALHSFEAQNGGFPTKGWNRYRLLPFIEEGDVYAIAGPPIGLDDWDDAVAFMAQWEHIVIPLYVCPGDSAPLHPQEATTGEPGVAGSNYFFNGGSGFAQAKYNGFTSHGDDLRAAEITDGLANTAAMSEVLRGSSLHRLRALWTLPPLVPMRDADQLDEFADWCESLPPDPAAYGWDGSRGRGYGWQWTNEVTGLYNHVLPPNRPSCDNAGDLKYGTYSAVSLHAGGVNTLYADGRVEFTSESIDRYVWREIGSRSQRIGEEYP